jgi:hypothetical protein
MQKVYTHVDFFYFTYVINQSTTNHNVKVIVRWWWLFCTAFTCFMPTTFISCYFLEAKLKHFLSSSELQRRDCRIWRCAHLIADQSPFQKLHHSRNEQSFITFTGLDYATFEYLLTKFWPLYQRYSPYSVNGKIVVIWNGDGRRGRPRLLDAPACLGWLHKN